MPRGRMGRAMSATNRGAVRAVADFYPTPAWCTRRILERLDVRAGASWLEPCAGEGALVRAIKAHDPTAEVGAYELRPEAIPAIEAAGADFVTACDALAFAWPAADVVIMNPPFTYAYDFVALALASGAPLVASLERIGWLCTWGKLEPSRMPSVFVLPERPSFTGKGTDASEYAWFVWGLPKTVVQMLPRTPLAERRAG